MLLSESVKQATAVRTKVAGAYLIIWKKAMRLSTKEVVIPNPKHRKDNRNLFREIHQID